jgi:hypothetical protein
MTSPDMDEQAVPPIERDRHRIIKCAQKLFSYAKMHPFDLALYLLIFAVGIAIRSLVLWNYGSVQTDEAAHSVGGVFISRLVLNGFQDPFAFGSRYLTDYPATVGGIWFYPLTYGLLSSPGFLLFGVSGFLARIISALFSVLLIHASVLVSKEIDHDHRVNLVTAFLVATSSILVIVGSGAMLDVPQVALTMYTILFWFRAVNNHDSSAFLKAGILGGLTGLIKPTGIFILLFMMVFQKAASFISGQKDVFSKGFRKGMIAGFLIFSIWWVSAFFVYFVFGGQVGGGALEGVGYWFNIFGVFGKYLPPWYSPAWTTYEGWTYYSDVLIAVMGILPFVFSFVGVLSRSKKFTRNDWAIILFALSTYAIQSFASNKNPRYIITCLPILYIYSSIGFVDVCSSMDKLGARMKRAVAIPKLATIFTIFIFLAGAVMPLYSAINMQYVPGMGYGKNYPVAESVRIIKNDGSEGIIVSDSEDNFINFIILTFYVAPIDGERRFGCYETPSNPEELLSFHSDGKYIEYVIVHDPDSEISKFIQSNPGYFELIGKAENSYGSFQVYKVTRHV